MAMHETGIAIVIKAFLPTGKNMNEQYEALSKVKAAHESGDYSSLLKAAKVEEVKTESKTRRVEKATASSSSSADKSRAADENEAKDVPDFLKQPKAARG